MKKFSRKLKSKIFNFLLQMPDAFGDLNNEEGILPFLNEVWELKEMPSTDKRFQDAYKDIYHHTINNNDWSIEFLFKDRLNLFKDDTLFQKFLEKVVNPNFRKGESEQTNYVIHLNQILETEGLKLAFAAYNKEGSPVFTLQNKEEIDDLPRHVKLNDIPFFVEKISNGRSKNKSSHNHPSTAPSFVLVFNDGWNDFSIWSEFSLFYYPERGSCNYIGDTKIIFGNELNTPEYIPEKFKLLNSSFCSLGQSIRYYKNLKEYFGDDVESILYSLRDAAFFPQILEAFERQYNFRNSLVRYNDIERLLREAKPVLFYGDNASNLYNFIYKFQPAFSDTPVDVNFDFDTNTAMPNRIFGLIGKNGTGKTQLVTSLPNKIASKEDSFFLPRAPFFSKVIAVSYSVFDRFEIPKSTASFNYVYCGLRDEKGEFLSEIDIAQRLFISYKAIEKQHRINKWRKILLNLIDKELIDKFITTRKEIENQSNKYELNFEGFEVVKNILSSGQSILLYIISQIVANIRFDSLLIYDEPETHLHPNAITQLMNTIYDLVHEFESYCIIATHSPLVIRELFSRNVYIIERHENTPSVRRIGIESFGENLSTLTDEVFGNKVIPKQYKKIIQELVNEGKSYEDILSEIEFGNAPLSLNARLFIKSQLKGRNEDS